MGRERKYIIDIEPSEGSLEGVRKNISNRIFLEPKNIQDLIEVQYNPFVVASYGVNPEADRDYRAFVDLISPNGESLLPPSDISLRVSNSDIKSFIDWCLNRIKKDLQPEDFSKPVPN